MRNAFILTLGLVAAGSLAACDSFVEDVDSPIDRVLSDSLDTQIAVSYLATGVEEGFNDAYDATAVLTDLLSDVGQFNTCVNGSTFPTFGDIDRGEITLDNNSVDGVYNAINEYRYLADDIIRRANETITFTDDEAGEEARRLALYTGNFHGAIARYMLASTFGLTENEGGAPINMSAIIPSAQLYADAITRFQAAKDLAASDYEERVINSLIARTYLYAGNRSQAQTFAALGLTSGDAPYTGDYAATSQNNWYTQGGRGRTQVTINERFADDGDPRTDVEVAPTATACAGNGITYYRQAEYTESSDSIPFITWQENFLILAEVALLEGGDQTSALSFVNAARQSYNTNDDDDSNDLADLDALDQETLLMERDKTLFTMGARLIDMRRFGIPFTYVVPSTHTEAPVPGGWRFLPVTQSERNANPNI